MRKADHDLIKEKALNTIIKIFGWPQIIMILVISVFSVFSAINGDYVELTISVLIVGFFIGARIKRYIDENKSK